MLFNWLSVVLVSDAVSPNVLVWSRAPGISLEGTSSTVPPIAIRDKAPIEFIRKAINPPSCASNLMVLALP